MSEKRDKQIKQIANELFPDDRDADKYTGFLDGAIWADKHPVNVWHNPSEEPQGDNYKILCVDDFDLYWVDSRVNALWRNNKWNEYIEIECVKMWAYISDLLPKQFGNSERLKGGTK